MSTINVSGISSQTSQHDVEEFFKFCGQLDGDKAVKLEGDSDGTQKGTIRFKNESAAKTALLLDNTQLGPNSIHVTAPAGSDPATGEKSGSSQEDGHISQEDKPRARIVAEYLAHGYVISDKAIERALQLDQQHGISSRFTSALQQFDTKFKATERAQAVDQKYAVSSRANEGWKGLASYFEQAVNTPTGQKLRAFYEQGSKQVLDVHNEARHLATLKTGKPAPGASGSADATTGTTGETATGPTSGAEKIEPTDSSFPAGGANTKTG